MLEVIAPAHNCGFGWPVVSSGEADSLSIGDNDDERALPSRLCDLSGHMSCGCVNEHPDYMRSRDRHNLVQSRRSLIMLRRSDGVIRAPDSASRHPPLSGVVSRTSSWLACVISQDRRLWIKSTSDERL